MTFEPRTTQSEVDFILHETNRIITEKVWAFALSALLHCTECLSITTPARNRLQVVGVLYATSSPTQSAHATAAAAAAARSRLAQHRAH